MGRQVVDGEPTNLGFNQEPKEILDGDSIDECSYSTQVQLRDHWCDLDAYCPLCLDKTCIYERFKEKYFDCVLSGELLGYYDGAVPVPVPNLVLRQASYRFWFTEIYPEKSIILFHSKLDLPRCVIDMIQGHFPMSDSWDQVGFEEEVMMDDPPSDASDHKEREEFYY